MKELIKFADRKKINENFIFGIVIINDKGEYLLSKDKNEFLDNYVFDILKVDINSSEIENIKSNILNKYGIKVKNIDKYINEYKILDNDCNEKIQINFNCTIENFEIFKNDKLIWYNKSNNDEKIKFSDKIIQIFEILDYNAKNS